MITIFACKLYGSAMKKIIISILLFTYLSCCGSDVYLIERLKTAIPLNQEQVVFLQELARQYPTSYKNYSIPQSIDIPLFRAYPTLGQALPYISLGSFPTPVQQLSTFSATYGLKKFYMKLDGLSGGFHQGRQLFGGNKVRKLEFLLADAVQHGVTTVMTFGAAGSNHALCTAVYAQLLGLDSILHLLNQANSRVVQRNLLSDLQAGARINAYENRDTRAMGALKAFVECKVREGRFPYSIRTGGSCPLGATGFVNAVFELKEQIISGDMPEPDRIYVALGIGSSGTAAGLLVGLKAAGLKSKLIAVGVEPENFAGQAEQGLLKLAKATNAFLHEADESFPLVEMKSTDYQVITTYGGRGYGIFTSEGMQVKAELKAQENILLDGTYTAKAFAGFLADCQSHKDEILLFWHTFDGTARPSMADYRELPLPLHKYFETDVQELDR